MELTFGSKHFDFEDMDGIMRRSHVAWGCRLTWVRGLQSAALQESDERFIPVDDEKASETMLS